MTGVVYEVPVPRDEPPVAAAYQLMVPADAVALSNTVPVPPLLPSVVDVIEGISLTVAFIEVLADVQPLFVASA